MGGAPFMPFHGGERPRQRGFLGRFLPFMFFSSLLSSGSLVTGMPATSGVSTQALSVPYTRSMLFDGLPSDLVPRLEEVLDVRFAASTVRSMNSGMRIWRGVCERYGWPTIIETDDPHRAAKLVTCALHMVDDTELVYASIQNYLWGIRQYMILHRQADPVMGVSNWGHFVRCLSVLTHVPAEPRKSLPIESLELILKDTDMNSFEEVQHSFFLTVLYFTFSRSECPCPKTFDGFDPEIHWQVRDILWRVVGDVAGTAVYALGVRFKGIKQDPRMERPAAAGDGDWAYVGDVPGSTFSILFWLKALMAFYAGLNRRPDDPFFVARDRTRPYTYRAAMADFRVRCARVGLPPDLFGLHSCRVGGYNTSVDANGEEITTLHGGWSSTENASRYRRFNVIKDVLPMVSRMVRRFAGESESDPAEDATPGLPERVVMGRRRGTPSRRRSPSAPATPAAGPSGGGSSLAAGLPDLVNTTDSDALLNAARREVAAQRSAKSKEIPPGFVPRLRSGAHLARAYTVYQAPDGRTYDSIPRAWIAHTQSMRDIPRSRSDPDLASRARGGAGSGRSSSATLPRVRSNPHLCVAVDAPAALPSSSADTPTRRSKSPVRRGRKSVAVPAPQRAKNRELRALLASSERMATKSGR